MSSTSTKTLPKRISTKESGIYYKEVQHTTIDDHGNVSTKIIDKVYLIRYRSNGKQHFVTLGKHGEGIRLAYCKTKRDEYVTVARNGELPPQVEKRRKKQVTTLDDLAVVYFADNESENKNNIRQLQKYNQYFGYIEPVSIGEQYKDIKISSDGKNGLGSKDITTITKDDVKKLQTSLKGKKAPKTINNIIQLLTAIINYSIKHKSLQLINPCTGIKRLEADNDRQRFLSLDEVKLLLDEVRDNEALYHFTKLALTTGARLESVLHIQKKDINLNNNSVTIHDLKSGGTYIGFYDDEYKQELAHHIKHLTANNHIVGGKAIKFPTRTITRHLKKIIDRLFNAGLEVDDRKNRAVIHTLRHTFASQLAIAGVPILTIKNLMHHAHIAQTERYAKLAPDQGKDDVKRLFK